jgi:hypothetical protein
MESCHIVSVAPSLRTLGDALCRHVEALHEPLGGAGLPALHERGLYPFPSLCGPVGMASLHPYLETGLLLEPFGLFPPRSAAGGGAKHAQWLPHRVIVIAMVQAPPSGGLGSAPAAPWESSRSSREPS